MKGMGERAGDFSAGSLVTVNERPWTGYTDFIYWYSVFCGRNHMQKRVLGMILTIVGLIGISLVLMIDNIFADVFGLILGFILAVSGLWTMARNW